jgi:hypothetical protein
MVFLIAAECRRLHIVAYHLEVKWAVRIRKAVEGVKEVARR